MSRVALPLHRAASPTTCQVIGVEIDYAAGRGSAAAVTVHGQRLDCRVELGQDVSAALSDALQTKLEAFEAGALDPPAIAGLGTEVAQFQAELVGALATPQQLAQTMVVGTGGPDFWHGRDRGAPLHFCPANPAALAEATGLTTVDDFAARDLAGGGSGGPLDPLPIWILLHDIKKPRVFVDLADTTRLIYLPASCDDSGAARVLAAPVGPGLELLRRLAAEGSPSETIDIRLAVRGTVRPRLVESMMHRLPEIARGAPAVGMALDPLVAEALQLASRQGWSIYDVLCSATHVIVETVVRGVVQRIPKTPPLQQIVLGGPGREHGLLVREIGQHLEQLSVLDVAEIGPPAAAFGAASMALLAYLHLEQVPATHSLLTGVANPRVLGRLTPGSPQNWQHLLQHLAHRRPAVMSLRSAM